MTDTKRSQERHRALCAIAKACREFGYSHVSPDEITGSYVLSLFARSSLEEAADMARDRGKNDSVLRELLAECEATIAKGRGGK